MSATRQPHRSSSVQRAIELKAAGWTDLQIAAILERETGRRPGSMTVRRWTDPDWAQADKERSRRRHARLRRAKGIPPRYSHSPVRELLDEDLLALRRDDHLTYTAISRVLWRFYAVRLSADQVRYRLYALGAEKNANRARPKVAA